MKIVLQMNTKEHVDLSMCQYVELSQIKSKVQVLWGDHSQSCSGSDQPRSVAHQRCFEAEEGSWQPPFIVKGTNKGPAFTSFCC